MIAQSDELERALQENLKLRQQLAAKVDKDNSKSQRLRLSGWQRIGIILSVIWLVVGSVWGWMFAVAPYRNCVERAFSAETLKLCQLNSWVFDTAWILSLLFALLPIVLGWLLVYLVVWIVRWVRRGFRPAV